MPDLRKTLGELYESSEPQESRSGPLDDDLATALTAALVSAPSVASGGPADIVEPAPAAAEPARPAPATRSRMAGTLREFHRDAIKPAQPLVDHAAPAAASTPSAATAAPLPSTVEPLPGVRWQLEDDDILPAGAAKAVRGIHLSRRK